ncbi:hypothetical protein [Nocardia terpenica]|uniref:Uncharacterized protein n=2 Tax=Nocardia terpenica TaxID=455432 RepID=A0A164KRG3_9NOCA|nr:hypothetical protein [Nocardia terpenica]KZM71654.1 hypothetical protein AWN90_02715 [Nocardia terpenica]
MSEIKYSASIHEIIERRDIYRREFVLNAFCGDGGLYVSAGPVSGLMMPRPLAARVIAAEGLAPVPAVSIHPTVWMLLADGPTSLGESQRITMRLLRFGVTVVIPRGVIGLPTPGDSTRVWIHPPQGRTRPTVAALGDAITTTAAGGRRGR